jgi:predicted transcriptional regulator
MEQVERKMIPYSVYLPKEHHARLTKLAKERKASALIRDAICVLLDGGDQYKAGYNQGLRDAAKSVTKVNIFKEIAYKGKYIDTLVTEIIEQLEMS